MEKNGKQIAEIYKNGKSYVAVKIDDELLEIEITKEIENKIKSRVKNIDDIIYNGNKIKAIFDENGKLIDYLKA